MFNYVKTFGLMALLTVLLVGIAGYFGGTGWMVGAFIFAALFNFGSYWFSDRVVLRMYGAEVLDRRDAPELYGMVDRLRREADLPMPTLAIASRQQPNAFATGRSPKHSLVCVTQGLLDHLDGDEVAGVIAHELAHIKNRDMLIGTVAATMAAAIVMLARFGFFFGGRGRGGAGALGGILMLLLAPLAAMLIRSAISRTGEFRADRAGASISRRPRDLADALRRLDSYAERIPMEVNQAAAHLCIVNPLRGGNRATSFAGLFSTHPPTEERIRRLEDLALGRP